MILSKPIEDSAFVWQLDAQSRVAIWAANHIGLSDISKLGLTHVSGGAADSSGRKILHGIWSGLTLERQNSIMPPGQLQHQHGMIPTTALATQQMGYAASLAIPQVFPASPCNIPQIISEMTGGYDPVYVAEKLGLFQRDMDNVSGPKLCRAFCEPNSWGEGINYACYKSDGTFKVCYSLLGSSVFEVKSFKFTDSPAVGNFLFSPSKSAIFTPPGNEGVFTTSININLILIPRQWVGSAQRAVWRTWTGKSSGAMKKTPVWSGPFFRMIRCLQ